MPKRMQIESVLIIGAGPIVIGQACEFDYSGVQACKALREEGYRVILVNSNPATVMTDPDMADAVYIEPVTWQVVEKIIQRERCDAVLPTMGGQTALNCALDLVQQGVLERYGVEMIGANYDAIQRAEDRQRFKKLVRELGLECAESGIAHSLEDAFRVQEQMGYPVIIRPSFTLGGSGGGIAYNRSEFIEICERGLEISPTSELLIEESLIGWKEFEMEVVRDHADNCIIVCAIENFDPMGVHTGDSVTVAPAQTLTDKEYQQMRCASIDILRKVGVDTGGANVQFALDPETGRLLVIEMNPRVSRSSALASKATGFPIAKVAAKLAVGYTLDELRNEVTGGLIPASFEPVMDYVVTKVPRFAFEKFPVADDRLSSQMKSVGEVMAVGRSFQESFQKALRGLETGCCGLDEHSSDILKIKEELVSPGPNRLWFIADAFRQGCSLQEVYELSRVDPWFLEQICALVVIENELCKHSLDALDRADFWYLKRKGFSDLRLAALLRVDESLVREKRWSFSVRPVYKRIDTCAAEFQASTAYLYSCYDEETEISQEDRPDSGRVVVLGGGPNRIGQGIEFDYCCVHAVMALQANGVEAVMVNCNPETVSTDYDIANVLYFEPLSLEDILEVVAVESPRGVIVQYGGQTPLKLAKQLEAAGVPILGTLPDSIDCAEDRQRFQEVLDALNLRQPPNRIVRSIEEAIACADQVGYPLVVRPSYVLGGRAMEIVQDQTDLVRYVRHAVQVSEDAPILLDHFLNDAIEIDVDAVSDGQQVVVAGIMEHIERAGIHSGDSACSLPPHSISEPVQAILRAQTEAMARALNVVGLMNVQFAIQGEPGCEKIFVLEVNPRASRTIPFVSKAVGIPFAQVAVGCMLGRSLAEQGIEGVCADPPYFSVKEVVLPFTKFQGADALLGPEMRSTGEVMGVGETFSEAFCKSQMASGVSFPSAGAVFISVTDADKAKAVEVARQLHDMGYQILATRGTGQAIMQAGIEVSFVNKVAEGRPHIVDLIISREVNLIVNTVDSQRRAIEDSCSIRVNALQARITLYTTIAGAIAACAGMRHQMQDLRVYQVSQLHRSVNSGCLLEASE